MTSRNYERNSNDEMSEKSSEQKKEEALHNIQMCFSDKERLKVTQSQNGNDRIRAFIPDENHLYAYYENDNYAGIAKVMREGKIIYLAEQYFPYDEAKPTFQWEFAPDTRELLVKVQSSESDKPESDLTITANAEQEDQFLQLTQGMASVHYIYDLEENRFRRDLYTFKLDELQ